MYRLVQFNSLYNITNVSPVKDMRNIGNLHNHVLPFVFAKRMFDAGSDIFETERIIGVKSVRIANCNAYLANTSYAFLD